MPNMWQSVQTTDSSCGTPQILCRWEILVSKCCKAMTKENNHLSTRKKNICHPKRMNMFKPNVQDLLQFCSAVMCSFVAWTQVCYLATAKKVSKNQRSCWHFAMTGFSWASGGRCCKRKPTPEPSFLCYQIQRCSEHWEANLVLLLELSCFGDFGEVWSWQELFGRAYRTPTGNSAQFVQQLQTLNLCCSLTSAAS